MDPVRTRVELRIVSDVSNWVRKKYCMTVRDALHFSTVYLPKKKFVGKGLEGLVPEIGKILENETYINIETKGPLCDRAKVVRIYYQGKLIYGKPESKNFN